MEKIIGKYKIEIIQDENPSSPREWDNLGTMICFHRRYSLGDKHDFRDSDAATEFLDSNRKKIAILLPLYLYDHSGITMNTTGFSCRWDSGQVGVIYITKEKIRKEYNMKRVSKQRLAKVKEYLIGEVKTYDQYLTGDVYGYKITEVETDEEIDSCWGYFGQDHCLTEAESIVNSMIKNDKTPVQLELPFYESVNEAIDNFGETLTKLRLSEQ